MLRIGLGEEETRKLRATSSVPFFVSMGRSPNGAVARPIPSTHRHTAFVEQRCVAER